MGCCGWSEAHGLRPPLRSASSRPSGHADLPSAHQPHLCSNHPSLRRFPKPLRNKTNDYDNHTAQIAITHTLPGDTTAPRHADLCMYTLNCPRAQCSPRQVLKILSTKTKPPRAVRPKDAARGSRRKASPVLYTAHRPHPSPHSTCPRRAPCQQPTALSSRRMCLRPRA